jgi:hypothetical protein
MLLLTSTTGMVPSLKSALGRTSSTVFAPADLGFGGSSGMVDRQPFSSIEATNALTIARFGLVSGGGFDSGGVTLLFICTLPIFMIGLSKIYYHALLFCLYDRVP